MAKFDKMYHDFFGIKPQLNEADLVNKISDYRGGFFYVRLGEDPAKESQRIQGFISQLPEVEKFSFTLKPIQKQVTKQTPNI